MVVEFQPLVAGREAPTPFPSRPNHGRPADPPNGRPGKSSPHSIFPFGRVASPTGHRPPRRVEVSAIFHATTPSVLKPPSPFPEGDGECKPFCNFYGLNERPPAEDLMQFMEPSLRKHYYRLPNAFAEGVRGHPEKIPRDVGTGVSPEQKRWDAQRKRD